MDKFHNKNKLEGVMRFGNHDDKLALLTGLGDPLANFGGGATLDCFV